MMNKFLRNINPIEIKKKKKFQKKKKISLQEFLKGYIETLVLFQLQTDCKVEASNIINENKKMMESVQFQCNLLVNLFRK